MIIEAKHHFRGILGLYREPRNNTFYYTLTYKPAYNLPEETIYIEEGDHLVIRSPHDGSVIVDRELGFDYEMGSVMDITDGKYKQIVNGMILDGLVPGIEPVYWLGMFMNRYPADVHREAE